jgi:ATP-binding cassette, subfamily B, bacterial PglK
MSSNATSGQGWLDLGTLRDVLTRRQRRGALVLLGMMALGMVLETLGIGLVVPVIALMTQPNLTDGYPWLEPVLAAVGHPTQERLVVGAVGVLVAVYLVKAVYLVVLAWRLNAFVFDVQANTSRRLFGGYLRQPWPFHLQRNSAELIRNATSETTLLTHEVLLPGMKLVSEGLVVLGIAAILFLIEPVGALIVMTILGGAAWGYQRLTRRQVLLHGQARHRHEAKRIQHLQQGLGGAKEVKLLGREAQFLAEYDHHNSGFARAGRWHNTLLQFPPLWFEVLAMAGLLGLVGAMVAQGKGMAALLPTLGLFAAAAFRLMPSANRVMDGIQKLRYGHAVVQTIGAELALLEEPAPRPTARVSEAFRREIRVEGVRYRYPGAPSDALAGVSLVIPRGAAVGMIGDSGAGKTTLVDVILGLLEPTAGRVLVDGADIRDDLRGWQDRLGYVPQSIFLTDDTLRRNIAFGLHDEAIDDAAVARAVRAAQLEAFVALLPEGLDTQVGERGVRLSGGQRQRIGIARALYHDPPVLVLDEATSSLDAGTEQSVMQAVEALHGEKTIIIVTHRTSTVVHCDRLFRIDGGRIVEEGSFESLVPARTG